MLKVGDKVVLSGVVKDFLDPSLFEGERGTILDITYFPAISDVQASTQYRVLLDQKDNFGDEIKVYIELGELKKVA